MAYSLRPGVAIPRLLRGYSDPQPRTFERRWNETWHPEERSKTLVLIKPNGDLVVRDPSVDFIPEGAEPVGI